MQQGGSSASSETVRVRDHLEAGGVLGIIGCQGGRGGCVCGRSCSPYKEYNNPPHIHHEVLIGGYCCYLHCHNNDKGDEDNANKYTTDAIVVDPAVYPMNLYNRFGA